MYNPCAFMRFWAVHDYLWCLREKLILRLHVNKRKIHFHLLHCYRNLPEACLETRKMVLQQTLCNVGKEWKSTKLHYFMIKLWMINWTPPNCSVVSSFPCMCMAVYIFLPTSKESCRNRMFYEVFQFKVFLRYMYISCSAKYLSKKSSE